MIINLITRVRQADRLCREKNLQRSLLEGWSAMNNGEDDEEMAGEDKSVMIRFPGDGSITISITNRRVGLIESNCKLQRAKKVVDVPKSQNYM